MMVRVGCEDAHRCGERDCVEHLLLVGEGVEQLHPLFEACVAVLRACLGLGLEFGLEFGFGFGFRVRVRVSVLGVSHLASGAGG